LIGLTSNTQSLSVVIKRRLRWKPVLQDGEARVAGRTNSRLRDRELCSTVDCVGMAHTQRAAAPRQVRFPAVLPAGTAARTTSPVSKPRPDLPRMPDDGSIVERCPRLRFDTGQQGRDGGNSSIGLLVGLAGDTRRNELLTRFDPPREHGWMWSRFSGTSVTPQ
jgi:hypothetical protein